MRKRNNMFLGAILVVVGIIFLCVNYDLIDFDYTFSQFAQFWPLLLILAGLAVLLNERRTFYNPVTALLVAFAIPLGIYSAASKGVQKFKNEYGNDLHFDWDEDSDNFNFDWKDGEGNEENTDRNWENGENDATQSDAGNRTEQNFGVPFKSGVEKVKLDIGGGAAEFHLSESKTDVFGAKTLLNVGSYQISDEVKSNLHDIEFEMKKGNNKSFRFGDGDHNEVFLSLNKKPIWDIKLGIGAGDLDFDLSDYKVENLEVNTGAAAIEVKLGGLVDKANVSVESGVAKVELHVPEAVGCEIKMDGALNAKDFMGFTKIDGSLYRSPNFDTAKKKIFIQVDSGLSSVKVNRYK